MSILRLLIIISSATSSNDNLIGDQIFERFTKAFKDEIIIQNWMKSTKRESISEPLLFEETLRKIGDVISKMNTKKYTNIRSLFIKTNMTLENIGYPYLETYNILTSTKRIISIYDALNISKSKKNHFTFSEEVLYYEYDQIYKIHELTIVEIWHKIHFNMIPPNFYDVLTDNNNDSHNNEQNCISIRKIFDLSNYMLISILPTSYKTPVYVVTNSKGLRSSRWCTEYPLYCFIREKSKMVCPPIVLLNLTKCTIDKSVQKQVNIEEFMNQSFFCDRSTAKILIMMFHYYSDVTSKNKQIEIIREEDNEYQIKSKFCKKPSIWQIKEYWMQQEIDDLSTRKILCMFSLGDINKSVYSTIKSIQTQNKPIKTRLILLSCGHLLGFGFIDKFFRKYYMKYSKTLMCPTCKKETIFIVGSYDSVVYKYKQETSSCTIF